jgi:hypothetical protein
MQSPPGVTWIKVEPPSFDLAGVLLASLGLTGMLAAAAFLFGAGFGVLLIRRRRRPLAAPSLGPISLR